MQGTEFWADPVTRWVLIGWLLASVGAVVWSMVAGRRWDRKRAQRRAQRSAGENRQQAWAEGLARWRQERKSKQEDVGGG